MVEAGGYERRTRLLGAGCPQGHHHRDPFGPGRKDLENQAPTDDPSVGARLGEGSGSRRAHRSRGDHRRKAVAFVLKEAGRELHMAAPNKLALIAKALVKTDERDRVTLAHLYWAGFLPECSVPTPENDRLRTLVRARPHLGYKMTRIKNQCHALVTRNLLDDEMAVISDWFGSVGSPSSWVCPSPRKRTGTWRSSQRERGLALHEE